MTVELLIYPMVRECVARIAAVSAGVAMCCAVSATGELVLAPFSVPAALFVGSVSEVLMSILLTMLAWVAWWCHVVLLAGRGMELTRYAMLPVAVLSSLLPVCTFYAHMTGVYLLLHQADLPCICTALLLLCIILNLPRAKAAGVGMLVLIVLFGVSSLLYALTNVAALVWLSDICKSIACVAIYVPLRKLSRYARLVVSLPPVE